MWKSMLTSRPRLTCRRSPRFCLLWPRWGEFRRGAGVDVGEEIRTVVDQGPQVEVETLDQPLIHLLLKGSHVLGGESGTYGSRSFARRARSGRRGAGG